jgi:hypothetical protein
MRNSKRIVISIEHFRFCVINEETDLIVIGRQRFDIVLDEGEVQYRLFICSQRFGMLRDKAELQSFDLARDE